MHPGPRAARRGAMIVLEALLFSFGKVIATIGLARVGWLSLRDLILDHVDLPFG